MGRLWSAILRPSANVDLYSASPNALDAKRNVFSRHLKAASVAFGLRTGSVQLFQADGPKVEKARGWPYVLSRWHHWRGSMVSGKHQLKLQDHGGPMCRTVCLFTSLLGDRGTRVRTTCPKSHSTVQQLGLNSQSSIARLTPQLRHRVTN